MASFQWPAQGSGGGGSGITSINSDSTAAQTLTAGTSGTDFAIADNLAGGHAFNLPDAGAAASERSPPESGVPDPGPGSA